MLGIVMQDHAEETAIHRQPAVITEGNKAKLSELIHEMTDSRAGGPNHLGQVILTDSGNNRLFGIECCARADV
jgi:hypothetical protein